MDAVELGEGSTGVGDAVAVLQHGSAAENGQLLRVSCGFRSGLPAQAGAS